MVRRLRLPLLALLLACQLGCAAYEWLGLRVRYDQWELPAEQVRLDVPYRSGPDRDERRHRLDLYLPAGRGWPTLVFVPGGEWTSGDKALVLRGVDVYGNVGRYYATHGIAAAVVNYRLQPEVTWREQVVDVARAVEWLTGELPALGGDSGALFLSGHSAGAQLVSHVALDGSVQAAYRLATTEVCGVVGVSGAGYDLADVQTYELGADPEYYRERFEPGSEAADWRVVGSPVHYASSSAPPFLVLYGKREYPALQRQAHRLHEALQAVGGESQILGVAGQDHRRMVLAMSSGDPGEGGAGPAILEFVRRRAAICQGDR